MAPLLWGEAAPRLTGPRHLFTAALPHGVLGMNLASHLPPHGQPLGRMTLDAAVALEQAERWLPCLEDWLGCAVRPSLTPLAEIHLERRMFTEHLLVSNPEFGAELYLPLAALSALRTPPPPTYSRWTWHPMHCHLILDSVPLTSGEVQQIEPGALLLLPASFEECWSASLQPVNPCLPAYSARLYEAHGRLCVVAEAGTQPAPSQDLVWARYRMPIAVPVFDVLGWSEAAPTDLDVPALQAAHAVLVQGTAAMKSVPLTTGQLIPVGAGFGLRLDELSVVTEPQTHPVLA